MSYTISEKNLEDLIHNDINENWGSNLFNKGLELDFGHNVTSFRQVRLGSYGISDIISIGWNENRNPIINLIELKVVPFCMDNLIQLSKYMKAIMEIRNNSSINRHGYLTASIIVESIPDDDRVYLPHILKDGIKIFTTDYSLNGIEFDLLGKSWQNGEGDLTLNKIFNESQLLEMKRDFQSNIWSQVECNNILNQDFNA